MAGNLPDGCRWSSDLDYYEAMEARLARDRNNEEDEGDHDDID